jgi:uncharacterized protein
MRMLPPTLRVEALHEMVDSKPTLADGQRRVAVEFGFTSWTELLLQVRSRELLDLRTPEAMAEFVQLHSDLATFELRGWSDHPLGASPLSYVAMARFDTATNTWRSVERTGEAAKALIDAGASVEGIPGDRETPLITAASYGDADVAAVLIAAGARLDVLSAPDSGGVPNGSALLHAAVFGNTEVLDVLVAAGAMVRSPDEAAAAGSIDGWIDMHTDRQVKLRALIIAVDHERLGVIRQLVDLGTPINEADEVFARHPIQLAESNGRTASLSLLQQLNLGR